MSDKVVRVSVVVNNYNYAAYLRLAIDSALSQDYPAVEVVVVDDGSTDESRSIIAEYGDRVKAVLKENGGQASAFSAGFAAASGDVILFLDADDVLHPDAVSEAVRAFDGDDPIVKVQWPLQEIDAEGAPLGEPEPRPDQMEDGDLLHRVVEQGYGFTRVASTSGNAWSREFLRRVMPVPPSGDGHGADGYLHAMAPIFGRLRTLPRPLSMRRIHGENFRGARSIQWMIECDLRRHEYLCSHVAGALESRGVRFDRNRWEEPGTLYAWLRQVEAFLAQAQAVAPRRSTVVLLDEEHLGADSLPERVVLPFPAAGGRPADDDEAVAELELCIAAGAETLVIAPWCFWWLDSYEGLGRRVRRCRELSATEALKAFDLRRSAGGG